MLAVRFGRRLRTELSNARIGLPSQPLRYAAGALLGGFFFLAVALALATPGDVLTNLGRNLLTTLAVALLAYLWFYFWTSYRATARLRRAARERPEGLFSQPPRVGTAKDVLGRAAMVDEIVAKIRERPVKPQLLVGDTGSGKTSVLLALADRLARLGMLPIVVSLREEKELDFADLAKRRLSEYVEPYVSSDAEAERLWRWVCRRGSVVVIADDLDRARVPGLAEDPFKTDARVALEAAARRQLPVVVTSRPAGVPRCADVEIAPLGPLEPRGQAAAALTERWRRRGAKARDVEALIEAGKLTANPFYLQILSDLLSRRAAPKPAADAGEHATRVALLDAWRETLAAATIGQVERERRERTIELVCDFAASRLPPQAPAIDVSLTQGRWLQALHSAEQLGLLEIDDKGTHRFQHDAMHAYFASRVLPRRPELLLTALEQAPDAPRVQLAAIFAAAAFRDRDFCAQACRALLGDSDEPVPERRLLRATAAAELARAGAFHELDGEIAEAIAESRRDASVLSRRTALAELGLLSGERAIHALWEFAGDEDYDVRWAAVELLAARCAGASGPPPGLSAEAFVRGACAYRCLAPRIERRLGVAEALTGPRDDWTPEVMPLKHIAWLLPTLRTSLKALGDVRLDREVAGHLDRLIALERRPVTHQRGLEASLAQGFKADAMRNPHADLDTDALELLQRARFWYSQLNLIHAIAMRTAAREGALAAVEAVGELLRREHLHPYVRAATRLCKRASDDPEDLPRYIWADEGRAVSDRPDGLAPEAAQLVGDIVLLLNMNETGDEQEREAFGTRNRLPHCMGASTDRVELRAGCVGEPLCDFRLCPYEPALNRLSAHRELSLEFCSHQRRNATARSARLWDSQVRERSLRALWAELEARARR